MNDSVPLRHGSAAAAVGSCITLIMVGEGAGVQLAAELAVF